MRKRFGLALAVLLLILAALAWQAWRTQEPVYQGKPLSAWLEGYDFRYTQHVVCSQTDEAVRKMGTNAVPTLVAMLRRSDSSLKLKLFDLASRQHFIKIQHVRADVQNWRAAWAFNGLGEEGRCAVPELIKIYENPLSATSQRFTASALGNIGPAAKAAVPSLVRALNTFSQDDMTMAALEALGKIRAEPDLVVPAVIKCLGSKNSPGVLFTAMDVAMSFGADARAAIPALVQLLQSTNTDLRKNAAFVIMEIDPAAADKAGIKWPPE